MSMIENLNMINELGIRHFIRNEKVKWACPECGEMICVHKPACLSCEYDMNKNKSIGETYIALLRGINVGGKNKLLMKDLIELFTTAGCNDVRTYIQSGNIVFCADKTLARQIPALISKSIADHFGYQVPVVIRTADELCKIVQSNPFLYDGIDVARLHVAFLEKKPSAARTTNLDPQRSAPDQFAIHGREIYLKYPNGLARSKLTNNYFDSKLNTVSTMRNWKTVLKLQAMTVEYIDAHYRS